MNTNPCRAAMYRDPLRPRYRYQFPEKSAFLAPEAAAYRSPADPQRAMDVLVQSSARRRWSSSGMAVRSREGRLQFMPALACPETPFVVLHADDDGRPFGLVTAEGCWGHPSPPLLAGLEDRATASNLRKSRLGIVYVCATVEDMILLRSLGFAATTAAGLSRLAMQDVATAETPLWHSPSPPRMRTRTATIQRRWLTRIAPLIPQTADSSRMEPAAEIRAPKVPRRARPATGDPTDERANARWKSLEIVSSPGRPAAGNGACRPRLPLRKSTSRR